MAARDDHQQLAAFEKHRDFVTIRPRCSCGQKLKAGYARSAVTAHEQAEIFFAMHVRDATGEESLPAQMAQPPATPSEFPPESEQEQRDRWASLPAFLIVLVVVVIVLLATAIVWVPLAIVIVTAAAQVFGLV